MSWIKGWIKFCHADQTALIENTAILEKSFKLDYLSHVCLTFVTLVSGNLFAVGFNWNMLRSRLVARWRLAVGVFHLIASERDPATSSGLALFGILDYGNCVPCYTARPSRHDDFERHVRRTLIVKCRSFRSFLYLQQKTIPHLNCDQTKVQREWNVHFKIFKFASLRSFRGLRWRNRRRWSFTERLYVKDSHVICSFVRLVRADAMSRFHCQGF